jgi:hypothetical protein
MFKSTTRDLFQYIGLSLFGLVLMLLLMHQLGEVHGLIVTVIIIIGQCALVSIRLGVVQRELTTLQQQRGMVDSKHQQP